MAYYALINQDGIVCRVSKVDNKHMGAIEKEENGRAHLAKCRKIADGYRWVQTSYNGRIRKKYAAIGDRYDAERDAFITPPRFPSWVFDEKKCEYVAPVPRPKYPAIWREEAQAWVRVFEGII